MPVTIQTKGLVKKYGKRTVVNQVSFEVNQGEIVGLLGPNGAGKTTSFYQVVGLIKPDEGRVFLNNEDITHLPMYKRAQMGIGYLPQEASIFRKLSVEDNIAAILEMTKLTKQQQKEKLESLLNELRLQHVRKNNGDVLSGGERRRTEIARALSVDPKFMLLDEPFAGIDPIAVEDIQAIVARLKYKNIGILITDHNVTETLSICDRAYLLIEGKIFKHGTAEELAADEQVRKLYLGRNFELRRKDYLHEEARETGSQKIITSSDVSENAFLTSVGACIRETDRKLELLSRIGVYKGALGTPGNLNLAEYARYVQEMKSFIKDHSKKIKDTKLEALADELPDINHSKFKWGFNFYDNFMNVLVLGILPLFVISFFYIPAFSKLERLFSEVKNTMQKVQFHVSMNV